MTRVMLIGLRDRTVEHALRARGMDVTTLAPPGGSAPVRMPDPAPSVAVVDMRGDSEVPPIVNTLRRSHADLGIALLASSLNPNVLLDAMRAGASEVLADGFDIEDLTQAVVRLDAERSTHVTGSVFVVVGAKGGTGASTIAVNVAAELAREDRTLLLDLHPAGGDDALLLNAQPRHSFPDALLNTDRLDVAFLRGIVASVEPNLDLLAAPDQPLTGPLDASSLRRLMEFLKSAYTYTLIDLSLADLPLLDALDRIDSLVLVVTQELTAVRAARRLLPSLRATLGERVVVVVNRFDRRAGLTEADIEGMLGTLVAQTVPSGYWQAIHAINVGRPLVLEGRGQLPESIKELTHRLAGHVDQPDQRSLLGRLVHAGSA